MADSFFQGEKKKQQTYTDLLCIWHFLTFVRLLVSEYDPSSSPIKNEIKQQTIKAKFHFRPSSGTDWIFLFNFLSFPLSRYTCSTFILSLTFLLFIFICVTLPLQYFPPFIALKQTFQGCFWTCRVCIATPFISTSEKLWSDWPEIILPSSLLRTSNWRGSMLWEIILTMPTTPTLSTPSEHQRKLI